MCEKLQDILTTQQMKKDVNMLASDTSTAYLESFHSLLNHFAPKMIAFSYAGQRTRCLNLFRQNCVKKRAIRIF